MLGARAKNCWISAPIPIANALVVGEIVNLLIQAGGQCRGGGQRKSAELGRLVEGYLGYVKASDVQGVGALF